MNENKYVVDGATPTIRAVLGAFALALVVFASDNRPARAENGKVVNAVAKLSWGTLPITSVALKERRASGLTPSDTMKNWKYGDLAVVLWDEVRRPKPEKTSGSSVSTNAQVYITINGSNLNTFHRR